MTWDSSGREARRQRSSITVKIIALSRGRCDVQLPDGRIMKAIHFAQGFTWPIGSWVVIERVETDWQVIGNGPSSSAVIVLDNETVEIFPRLADWLYARGGADIGRWAISGLPDPNAPPVTLWTGTSVVDAVPLGVLSLAEGNKIITAQILRNNLDTLWEKLRLHVVGDDAEELDVNLTADPTPIFGFLYLWSNIDGSFVIAHLAPTLQIYRRRGALFQALNLTGLSRLDFDRMNVIGGTITSGAYTRQVPSCTGTTLYLSPTATFGTGYPANGGYIEGWASDVAATSIARTWQTTPEEILQLVQPAVQSWSGQVAQAGGSTIALASGREALWVANPSEFNLGLSAGFIAPPSNASVVALSNSIYSRLLKGVVAAIDPATGSITGRHIIAVTPIAPVLDNGLIQPMENTLQATMPVDSGPGIPNYLYTWGGRHAHEDTSVRFHDPIQVGDCRFANFPFVDPNTDTPFSGPNFEIFGGAGIGVRFLPMSVANNALPVAVGPNFRTTGVFVGWPGDSALSNGAISCNGDSAYVAYLRPKAYLYPDALESQTINNGIRLETINAIAPPGYFYGSTIKFLPEVAFFQERFLAKLTITGSAIALAWTTDLTQLVTAAWWRRSDEIAPPFGWPGNEFVGGNSSSPVPLGDQIYQISAVGRAVFATIDYHPLGAKFQPETKLAVLDDSTGAFLYNVGILPSTATLPSDINGPGVPTEFTENYTIAPDTFDDHVLTHNVYSILFVYIDGIPGVNGVDYDYVAPNRIQITAGPSGAEVEVVYEYLETGPVLHYAGERRYAVTSHELRTGKNGAIEWAIIFATYVDRTNESALSRTIVVETNPTLPTPVGSTIYAVLSPTSPGSVAISNGHMLRIEYLSGEWVIRQV